MTSIITQTSNRWEIPNTQHFDAVGNEDSLENLFISKFNAEIRTKATGRYNCHGLTFASRRTCIDDSSSVARILEHDKYKEVILSTVLPGDVILYVDNDGIISHSGIVTEVTDTLPRCQKIVSKWGVNGAEFIHWAHSSPYGTNYKFYRMDHSAESSIISKIIIR
ncbi:hypothetical protein [Acidovorax sp. A1169]|uniref:hypothetical protein n=1 Tax=Acidovorax sp. A1169 TaxID=3059524 RepID=UPI002737F542|nr:hypothetical protein [Acidovorax sp. A1169]MDP4078757.1 hypothetical protein [Acidovorax sp. A1169]